MSSSSITVPGPQTLVQSSHWRPLSRGLIAGFVDAYSLLTFKVYTSFMSGNTISSGMKAGQGKAHDALHSFIPIPSFLLGTILATLMQKEASRRSNLRVSLAVIVLLGLTFVVVRWSDLPELCAVLLGIAMGMLNMTVSKVAGQSVNLGFVTGDLKNLGESLGNAIMGKPISSPIGPWDTQGNRARVLATVWLAFIVGAVLGAVTGTHLLSWALLVAALALLLLALSEYAADNEKGR